MKKVYGFFLALVLLSFTETNAQTQSCSQLKFSGVAPFPWAINGQINDWETILGPVNNNPFQPFGATIGINGSYDTYGNNDPDNPDPTSDLRASAIIQDDYNVYFYLRRLHKSNTANKAFYFLDPNMDGLMQSGEPVIIINFNAQTISNLSLGRYVATSQQGDNISNRCIVDGFAMSGGVVQELNSVNATLQSNEIFSAAITENGYGIEIAVPWRLISNYKYFTYHLALQKGNGLYNPTEISDNAGGCGPKFNYIGSSDFYMESSSVQTLVAGSSYRISTTYRNQTPGEILVSASGVIDIENIISQNNLPVNETQFTVTVNEVTYTYVSGSFINQPIKYAELFAGFVVIPAFGTGTIIIDITFPPNGSVKSATINIKRSSFFYFIFEERRGCISNAGGGGGKPINPIGFELGDETTTGAGKNKTTEAESDGRFENRIRVYPNPSSGNFNIGLPDTDFPLELTLTDYTGKLIRKWSGVRQSVFRVENLKQGFYLLSIRNKDGRLLGVKKLISQ